MLQALLHNKISGWFTKPAWEIEDLLTAAVFGSCEYAGIEGWRCALRPFLAAACAQHSLGRAFLDGLLPKDADIESVGYEFWPSFGAFDIAESIPTDRAGSGSPISVGINGAIPEVLITLTTRDGRLWLVLIEVKLNIGKSCCPADDKGVVADQLAKYWMHLKKNIAAVRGAEALAVVYVTPGTQYPSTEIEASRRELSDKLGETDPPIFWVSWRKFVGQVVGYSQNNGKSLPKIIDDILTLLKDQWGFFYEEIQLWAVPPNLQLLPKLKLIFKESSGLELSIPPEHLQVLKWGHQLSVTAPTHVSSIPWPVVGSVESGWNFTE